MVKKGGNFFEEYIEKLVLAIVGALCVWLLISRVVISPNYVLFENKKFSPGEIDNYILNEYAELLKTKLAQEPEPKEKYEPRAGKFLALVDSAISNIDTSLSLPQPNNAKEIDIRPIYGLPQIGEVEDVGVEHIRAVAYVPTEEIDEENIYEDAENEPNDIDFVTVEAKFDVAQLYKRFYENFASEDVREEWRDPCISEPVFGAVQLQRRELLADGSWSDWQVVPRTKIDYRRKMFEVIEEFEDLPAGGVKVRMLQFDDEQVRDDLLQPIAYQIASAREDWYPPSLHKKYAKQQREIGAQERRQARGEEKAERERELEEARAEREKAREERRKASEAKTSPAGGAQDGFEAMLEMMMGGMPPEAMGGAPTTTRKKSRTERRNIRDRQSRRKDRESERERPTINEKAVIDDIEDELNEILIAEKTDLANMSEPLTFWAHDDTIEPEKAYRYKIRLGVFNPIAGTEQLSEQYKHLKNKVVLWSEFSDETEAVEVPGTLYFFPRDIQEAAKTVTIQVSKYVLGYWYSKDFTVKQGEVIGKTAEYEPAEGEEDITVPETIDYDTGAVLVDVMGPVKDWSGRKKLRERYYTDMLYSSDGFNIEHMSIKPRNWPEEQLLKFNEISKFEKGLKEPLQAWGSRGRGRGRRRRRFVPKPSEKGRPGYDEELLEYMMSEGLF